jgi:hypothetical protein
MSMVNGAMGDMSGLLGGVGLKQPQQEGAPEQQQQQQQTEGQLLLQQRQYEESDQALLADVRGAVVTVCFHVCGCDCLHAIPKDDSGDINRGVPIFLPFFPTVLMSLQAAPEIMRMMIVMVMMMMRRAKRQWWANGKKGWQLRRVARMA